MTTSAYGGMTGSVTVGSLVTEVKNWKLKRSVKAGDATSMASDGWVERIPLMKGGEFSFESLQAPGTAGAQATLSFKSKSSGGITISGAGVITKVSDTTDVRGVVTFTTEGKLSGAITVA